MFSSFKNIVFIFTLILPVVSFGSAGSTTQSRNNGDRDYAIMKEVIKRMIKNDKCFDGDTSWLDTSPREYNEQRNRAFNEYLAVVKDITITKGNAPLIRKYKAEVEREWDQADTEKKERSEIKPLTTAVIVQPAPAAASVLDMPAPATAKSAAAVFAVAHATPQAANVRPRVSVVKSAELKYSKEVIPAIDWTQKKYKDQLQDELDAIKDVKYEHTPKQLTWAQTKQMSKKSLAAKKPKSKEKHGILQFYRNNKILVGACLGAVTGAIQIALFKKYVHNCPNSLPSNAATAPFVGLGVLAGSAAGYFDVIPGAFVGANAGGIAGRLILEPVQGAYYKGDRQAPALLGGLIAGGIASATDTELPSALGAAGCVVWHYAKGDNQSVSVSTAPVGALMGTAAGYACNAAVRRRAHK